MTRKDVKRIVEGHNELRNFIEGPDSSISFNLAGVPIIIYKEYIGTRYYYRQRWFPNANYVTNMAIMNYLIPILSDMLEKKRMRDLLAPGNILKATPRYK